jgi:hypothetical protein
MYFSKSACRRLAPPPDHPMAALPLGHCQNSSRQDFGRYKSVYHILHASVGTDIMVAVVHHVFLRYKSHAIGRAGKGILPVASTGHSATNHNIDVIDFTLVIKNENEPNV